MPLKNKKILLTYGPTCVPIDRVRVISNISTGALGRALIEGLKKRRARVTVLEGPVRRPWTSASVRVKPFFYFDELARLMKAELKKKYDVVIHAAAVSDYRVRNPAARKLSSRFSRYTLTLVPAPKLIGTIKKTAPDVFLVGFKLEAGAGRAALTGKARDLMARHQCDLVVANILKGPGPGGYEALIIGPGKKILARTRSRSDLAGKLIELIEEKL